MANIGSLEYLLIKRITSVGGFLDGDQLGEILLPKRYLSPDNRVGDRIEVFVHKDSSDRLIATADVPQIQVGQFAYLKVSQVNSVGAFIDIGLSKELMVPFAEQVRPMEVGRSYLIYCYLNPRDQRLVGTARIDRWLGDVAKEAYVEEQEVALIVGPRTDLGTKVIVNHSCWGLIHSSHIIRPLRFGQCLPGYIQSVREDGKLNITLSQASSAQQTDSDLVLAYLHKNNGSAAFGDKSSPDLIAQEFGISKAAFKRAIGLLYRQKLIVLEKDKISLTVDSK